MKGLPIAFLLLLGLLPVAIESNLLDGLDDGGSVNASALYQELSTDLTGPNGTLNGMGIDGFANNLLSGLIGPNGTLTPHFVGVEGDLIATVLRFFLGPDGILSIVVGLDGGLPSANTLIEDFLNGILGPEGLVTMLFGRDSQPNLSYPPMDPGFGNNLEKRDSGNLVGGILKTILGKGGLVPGIMDAIFGRDGLLAHIFNGVFGPDGILAGVFGGFLRGGKSQGEGTGGNDGGKTAVNARQDTSVVNLVSALCQLQSAHPNLDLATLAQPCLNDVTSRTLNSYLMLEISNLSCDKEAPTTQSRSSDSMAQLNSFTQCVQAQAKL